MEKQLHSDLTADPGRHRHLYDLFESSVEDHADRIAIELGSQAWTYEELRSRAEDVAVAIIRHGVKPKANVGLIATRDLHTYAGYLGILRAGCAVVPISPEASRNRTDVVLKSAEITLAIGMPPAAGLGVPCVPPEEPVSEAYAPPLATDPSDHAYILFTSGSTGVPKGVPISHRSALAYVEHAIGNHAITPESRLSHAFELTFDPAVFDMFCAWGSGAAMIAPGTMELMMPVRYVNRRRITHWFSVPSAVSTALQIGGLPRGSMPGLLRSQFIGEQLTSLQAQAWKTAAPNSAIVNTYGPTELTVACAEFELPPATVSWPRASNETIPIGKIYPHLEYRLVDEEGADASEGELCVRGVQRFDGYLDVAQNEGRFIAAETGSAAPEEGPVPGLDDWYRTGDRVREEAGLLVHLGRLDRQVKVRGYRIELGEIEGAVRGHLGIREVVMEVVDLGPTAGLCAVLTGERCHESALQQTLAHVLPSYMFPDVYLWLEELPRNANGKIDHKAVKAMAQERATEASRTALRPSPSDK